MNNPYDMAVRTISLNQETKRVFVALKYQNGTALYCLNIEAGEIIWRLDPLITYNESKYLIYIDPIVTSVGNTLNALYIGGEGINADNLSSQEIPDWINTFSDVSFGFVCKIEINTGKILWFNANCSKAASKIEIGHFASSNKLELAAITPEGIILIDEETGTKLWDYNLSRQVFSYFSYLFTVESDSQNYSDLLVCFSDTNPRAIKLSGNNGTLLWLYDDSAQPNSYYGTKDAIVGEISADGVVDLILCNGNKVMAIDGANGSLLWDRVSSVSDIALGDLYSNGSKVIVGKFVEKLFFIDGMTGTSIKKIVIEEGYISGYVFLEDLNTDGKLEIIVSSFGSVIAILDASGRMHHYIKGKGVLTDILIVDVLGSADKEIIAGTVTLGWVGVLGHGLSSGIELFFPLLVGCGSLGLLGLLGGYFWWYKRKKFT